MRQQRGHSTTFRAFTRRNRLTPWAVVISLALVPSAVHVLAALLASIIPEKKKPDGSDSRRARAAGLSEDICCHTFRATGITAYLEGGGTIEHAQQIANHESPKITKLYDRTSDQIDLDEIEKIQI
jgi:integrase